MNEKQAMEYIEKISEYGSVLGLAGMTELMKRLGNPQDALSFIHVAGTNGKGSTLAFLSTICREAGYKTGRYTSPSVFSYYEKIQVNGRNITKQDFADTLLTVKTVADEMEEEGLAHPTVFEVETAVAFLYFKNKHCDIVVLETGLGGETDATNVVNTTIISVITSISKDHVGILGKTLTEIAEKKAGIIKEGVPVVTCRQSQEVIKALSARAEAMHSNLYIADAKEVKKIQYGFKKQSFQLEVEENNNLQKAEISLPGTWQITNAYLAFRTSEILNRNGYNIPLSAILRGLKNTVWPGRLYQISSRPSIVLDGAHNEAAAIRLRESIQQYFTGKRLIFIMGVFRDKEYEKVVANTATLADQIITVETPGNERALPAYELAQCIREYNPNVTNAASIEEALEMALLLANKEDVILAFGSLSYLGQLKAAVDRENRR